MEIYAKSVRKNYLHFLNNAKESTIEEIKKQLEYRAENYKQLDNLEINKIYGEFGVILIDEKNKKFVAARDTSESLFGSQKVVKRY